MPGIQHSTGRLNRRTRVIDTRPDPFLYSETVTDEETGEVLFHASHALAEHQGHGDDEGPRTSPPPQVAKPETRGPSQ